MTKTFARLALIASLSLVTIQPAVAQDSEANVLRSTVSYADLDLSTQAGRDTLNTRVKFAANKACGGAPSRSSTLREQHDFQACRDRAMAKAIAAIEQRDGKALASR